VVVTPIPLSEGTAEARQQYERRVRDLADLGHRGSGSTREAQAAAYLADELRAAGLEVEIEHFLGCSSLGARLLVHVIVAALGACLLPLAPWAASLLGLVALTSLILEQGSRGALLSRFLINKPSANVVARIPPLQGPVRRRVLVMGHYDTQRTGLIWRGGLTKHVAALLDRAPGMVKSPLFLVGLAMVAQIALGLAALVWPAAPAVAVGTRLVLVVHLIAGALLAEWMVGRPVPGASDNATGAAAAMELAEAWRRRPVPEVELVVLLTGCEETGCLGSTAWAQAHLAELRSVPTTFLNLDSFGYGSPRFLGTEHALSGLPVSYPAKVVAMCDEVAQDRGLTNAGPRSLQVATDGLPFLVRGIPGASVLCFEDHGYMPNYHQLSDTADNLDFGLAWEAIGFCRALLLRLAQAGS
jgi:Peptidase family M28